MMIVHIYCECKIDRIAVMLCLGGVWWFRLYLWWSFIKT